MKKIRLTSLFLILTFLLTSGLFACAQTTAGSGDETEPETQVPLFEVIAGGATEYTIIRSEDASAAEIDAAVRLRNEIEARTGVSVPLATDWVKRGDEIPAKAKEIVVGRTNRPQSVHAAGVILRERDFVIFLSNSRITIAGGNDEKTNEAVEYFLANYVTRDGIAIPENLMVVDRYVYPVASLKIGGADISDFTIVIPAGADQFETNTADLLRYYVLAKTGVELPVVTDNSAEGKNEFLIGRTSRAASAKFDPAKFGPQSYILSGESGKVIFAGADYMVAGGVSEFINLYLDSDKPGAELDLTIPAADSPKKFEFAEPNNVIYLIGDGMGFNHIKLAEANGMERFAASYLPVAGEAKTASLSGITDSAAGATALSSGYKTTNRYLGMDKDKKPRENISELAMRKGYSAGVISTDLVTGATPAGFMVHVLDRSSTAEIQSAVDAAGLDYVDANMGDGLLDSVKTGLDLLSNMDTAGFTLMIEGAHIDKRSHNNDAAGVVAMTKRFNDSLAYSICWTICNPDTVLLVTADHETGGIRQNTDGSFRFTSKDHTYDNVPVFAIGRGTEIFHGKTVENTEIPMFLITVFGETAFAD